MKLPILFVCNLLPYRATRLHYIHGVPKKEDTQFAAVTRSNLNRFATLSLADSPENLQRTDLLKIPPHHKRVATLPCEISVFYKLRSSKTEWSRPCKTQTAMQDSAARNSCWCWKVLT